MNKSTAKRIAVISDIHGNIVALEAVVADIKRKKVDQVINLGDHISGPLWPKETIAFLMQQSWINILGNHDRNLISINPKLLGLSDQYVYKLLSENDISWIKSLQSNIIFEGLFLFHGTPSKDDVYLLETVENGRTRLATQTEIERRLGKPKSKEMLCGHSHIPRVVEIQGSIIINPGSVGLPAYDDDLPEYHVVETGSAHARYAIIEYQTTIQSIEMIAVNYDYKTAVKQAFRNNRPDWAEALNSGFSHR